MDKFLHELEDCFMTGMLALLMIGAALLAIAEAPLWLPIVAVGYIIRKWGSR